MNSISLTPLFRSSIGFDRFNDFFESALAAQSVTYPPYNVEKRGDDNYRIVVAAAGVDESELDIQVVRNMLTISSARRESPGEESQYLYQGIAQRAFKLSFRLDDYIEVEGASLKNGLLHVDLVRRLPEAAKPRRIAVNADLKAVASSNVVSIGQTA
ncbi:Hsp20 family protein [Solimonas sp. SE-A11]|uniref:Hsp20 family protein n=1 Tax=Solimonas sp. SE-A11 TaxID=3054954 RepID=UPI00259CACB2|nr:Hsp20 family protein [Solimonas sp. SE-A11]MDM4771228.1 Hsp20 family protein [Solimonas sp. SE-A11]